MHRHNREIRCKHHCHAAFDAHGCLTPRVLTLGEPRLDPEKEGLALLSSAKNSFESKTAQHDTI